MELSYIDDSQAQEIEMNKFFNDFGKLDIEDQQVLYTFCNVMVCTSIELAQFTRNGELRMNNNTLDYRQVDSFIKLVVVLLGSGSFELNSNEFMSQIFEFIKIKLDEDHSTLKRQFNQKPYHRMLMNILKAVNGSECFN